ncbi:MAG: glucose 1-dehydrogenase [Deltaproteobacteria bacterium]|nr:MAG: glucose 1-dehydrogenase [Deltaproteobacteria bacterium]
MARLQGRVALVTGASRGIGEAIARAMAAEGASVVITSRRQEGLDAAALRIRAEVAGAKVWPKACHVGRSSDRESLMTWIDHEVGRVDILVNNAGTNVHFGPMLEVTEAAWDKTFEVNLKGPWELSRAVAQRLIAADQGGSILNVSSVLGRGASPLQGVYGMTKAALISMTQTLALEWGGAGIRVNALAPGLIDTRLSAALTSSPELTSRFLQRAGVSRVGQPGDLAGAAVFLASDEAAYITGTTLDVDGGYTVG